MSGALESGLLPTVRAADLDEPAEDGHWLVETILPRSGVTICGGAPKCCKSWMGLDLALSVASGSPCLGRFSVGEGGSALIYLAEDPPTVVRSRLENLCRARGLELAGQPIDVITAPSIRLDLGRDQERLARTIRERRPRLVLLDPFVRLHRVNENDAGEVSALLAYLRELQREFDIAIVVVHHARKSGTQGAQAGQGLRGSGDFFAFLDTLLYLRRHRDHLQLSVEHRAAPAPPAMQLDLMTLNDATHLALVDDDAPPTPTRPVARGIDTALLRVLGSAEAPLSRAELRGTLHCRMALLDEALHRLAGRGLVAEHDGRWARAQTASLEIKSARAADTP